MAWRTLISRASSHFTANRTALPRSLGERPMEGVEVNPQFWRGKKVFVTGHTGFKGSWLSILLQSFGADVVGFSLPPPTQPNLFTLAGVEHGMQSIVGAG